MSLFKSNAKPVGNDSFFEWKPAAHSVGIVRFDEDHQRLADLLNQIHGALIQDRDRALASRLMTDLIQETRAHFFQEETALREAAYPELEAHLAEHGLLLQEAVSLFRQFQAGSISGMAFPTFLKNWLIAHIQVSDRKYSACLRRKGER